jgi:hypothetical protein
MNQDEEHLKLLAIFHYVVAGLVAMVACFPLIHLALGLFLVLAPKAMLQPGQQPPPAFFGWILVVMAGLFILIGWTLAILILTAGRFLSKRKHHSFCFVIACIECMFIPFGTVLGVFTILVLSRESVKPMFAKGLPQA